jgi:hypothetical protein
VSGAARAAGAALAVPLLLGCGTVHRLVAPTPRPPDEVVVAEPEHRQHELALQPWQLARASADGLTLTVAVRDGCGGPATAVAAERPDRVVVTVLATAPSDCAGISATTVRLRAPLGARRLVDAADGAPRRVIADSDVPAAGPGWTRADQPSGPDAWVVRYTRPDGPVVSLLVRPAAAAPDPEPVVAATTVRGQPAEVRSAGPPGRPSYPVTWVANGWRYRLSVPPAGPATQAEAIAIASNLR